jgi:ribosomal protein S18 acetylase RimI-like enzyme
VLIMVFVAVLVIASTVVTAVREHRPSIAHRRYVTAKAQTNRRLVEAGQGGWFGAFLGARLVSQMGLFSAGEGLARFQSVETDPNHRRRGLAGSLLHCVSQYGFSEFGARTLVIVADPNYVAIDLYKAVGFAVAEAQLQIERAPGRAIEGRSPILR